MCVCATLFFHVNKGFLLEMITTTKRRQTIIYEPKEKRMTLGHTHTHKMYKKIKDQRQLQYAKKKCKSI